jgi:hypothetical protein
MKLYKFFTESWLRTLLTALSFAVFLAEWNRLGFQGTAQMGGFAVFLYCFSFGFSGAIVGVFFAAIIGTINKIRGRQFSLPSMPINVAWGVFLFGPIFYFFKQ